MHNISAGVITTNQSLVLQRVGRHSAGRYRCVAMNREGDTESDVFHLDVKCKLRTFFSSSFFFLLRRRHHRPTLFLSFVALHCNRRLLLLLHAAMLIIVCLPACLPV